MQGFGGGSIDDRAKKIYDNMLGGKGGIDMAKLAKMQEMMKATGGGGNDYGGPDSDDEDEE